MLLQNKTITFAHKIKTDNVRLITDSIQALFLNYPTIPIAASIIAGIVIGRHSEPNHETIYLATAVAATIAALLSGKSGKCQSTFILLGFICLGAFLAVHQESKVKVTLPEGEITYEATVITEAKEHPKTWSADMIITSGAMQGKTIKAFFPKKSDIKPLPTECITATSVLTVPERQAGTTFDYARYLNNHGISGTTFIVPWKYQHNKFSTDNLPVTIAVAAKLRLIRLFLINKISKWGMSVDAESLIAGIALGQKNSISKSQREAYSQAGAAHILALSGLHLGIIWSLLCVLCLGRWRTAGSMIALLTIWAYVMFAGMPVSAVRAAVMLTVMSLASLTNRRGSSLNTLAFAAIIILLISPSALYDVGFQLSFVAVAFIVIFTTPFMNILSPKWRSRHPWLTRLTSMTVVTVTANIGTLPLVALYFNNIPLYGLITNLIAIPLITVILWLFIVCITTMSLALPSALLSFLTSILDTVIIVLNSSISFIASLPHSTVSIHITSLQSVVLYIAILSLLWILVIIIPKRE